MCAGEGLSGRTLPARGSGTSSKSGPAITVVAIRARDVFDEIVRHGCRAATGKAGRTKFSSARDRKRPMAARSAGRSVATGDRMTALDGKTPYPANRQCQLIFG